MSYFSRNGIVNIVILVEGIVVRKEENVVVQPKWESSEKRVGRVNDSSRSLCQHIGERRTEPVRGAYAKDKITRRNYK
jgi:hypothetical protein